MATEAMPREAIEAFWRRLDEHHKAQATDAIVSPDELGQLLTEVERLKVELRGCRELYRHDDTEQERVPRALVAALELLARDVRDAQVRWSSSRFTLRDRVEAYDQVVGTLGLVERVRQTKPWVEVLRLSTEELRSLAQQGARS